ncbi:MAG: hypothetical protein IKS98_07405 [Lachnospiraceae bacterium]|nr:hypothetical protein [Lachnospiraceae bacterium]
MADSKSSYSNASTNYVTKKIYQSSMDMGRYSRSKNREAQYNEDWKKHMVNINDVIKQFAPNSVGKQKGIKFQFEGTKYIIKADMASGYLRIYDKSLSDYVKLNGRPGSRSETHFKIKKRSEM